MTAIKTRSRLTSARAFTLIEVLVASAVMVILVGIVVYITSTVMSSWNRSSGKLSANAEARLALEIIAQDLEMAILRNNGQQWLRVEESADLSGSPFSASNSVILKLFAPALNRQSGDGICAIAYKLGYQASYTIDSTDGPLSYALYRNVVSPQNTLNSYLSSRYENPANSVQGTLAATNANADWSDSTITDDSNYLAGNIVEFKVLIYDSNQASLQPRNGNANNQVTGNYIYGGVGSNAGNAVPAYADIILTVVTDEGAELLKTRTIGGNSEKVIDLANEDANDVVTQYGETFIRRVHFQSNPL